LETKTIPLLVQTYTPDKILYSEIYNLTNGKNTFEIAYTALNIQDAKQVRLLVSPLVENDVKIAFSWLELVQLKPQKESIDNKRPADKIKCVAWDLDNTLWKGVLIEDGIDNIKLHATAVNTIKKLDEKGILNTIISKNNYDEAMEALNKFGLCEYFIYPAINWGQKSENLKLVAKKINIGIDTFAFIDDNIRERAEVASSLPMVRVYADTDIDTLLDKPEFDVSVTEMSSKRRLSYLSEMKREELQGSFTDNYDDYIRSLQMELSVSFIDNDVLKNRCYELLLRSNQLNLSTNRYSEEEYETLLKDKSVLCLAFFCKDKFGDYGNIGFMSIKMCTGEALITDLVISCRIAKKKVEEAMIYAVKTLLIEKGITLLKANLIKTKKNSPIEDVFNSLPFKILYKVDQKINFQIDDLNTLQNPQLIRISYKNDFVS
jgi:FkbH-like protein